jgi:hypothetical protein
MGNFARYGQTGSPPGHAFAQKGKQASRHGIAGGKSDLVGRIYKSVKKIRPQAIISAAILMMNPS